MREFYFSSKLSRKYYKALEKLLFFNEKQALFIRDIEKNIEEYGVPRIVADGETLRIKTASINDVQNLFAFDREAEDADLIGLIVYFRPTLKKMIVLHIAVDENYTFDGKFSDQTLTIQLIDKVREIALKIKGIELLSISYGRDFTISIRE
jgi:hypothetical protein